MIDEFFKNQYSTEARFAILNALALGARELASLPVPHSDRLTNQDRFPSKRLPHALHQKYIALEGGELRRDPVVGTLVENITRSAIDSGREAAESKVAPLVRERQLRINQPRRVTEISRELESSITAAGSRVYEKFTDAAAEYFIGPFVGKFWVFLRDEKERESRTAGQTHGYHGSGIGLILNPLVLSSFLSTLLVLIHAGRHSPAFLSVLAPDTLELALTLGTIPLSRSLEEKELEAAVVNAALELTAVLLDACIDLDGGRLICLENGTLVMGVEEWASRVLGFLEDGVRLPGEGGVQEMKLRRSAAGVVLKVNEVRSRWDLAMLMSY